MDFTSSFKFAFPNPIGSATANNNVSSNMGLAEIMPDLHVVGKTIQNKTTLRVLGTSESPATSAATGATVPQNVPQSMPASRAKKHTDPKLFEKIQMTRQATPQSPVVMVAMLILPQTSLKWPVAGLPINNPRLISAPTIEL
ncbi:MAG: hypothetical protein Q9216_005787 [Gyalolechia sp. 2 TL-2023]